jgi:hypothetical protein
MTEFELLKPPAPELEAVKRRLCAEPAPADVQPLVINQTTAGWLATYVSRLSASRELNTCATYPDLISGSTGSVVITEQVPKRGSSVGEQFQSCERSSGCDESRVRGPNSAKLGELCAVPCLENFLESEAMTERQTTIITATEISSKALREKRFKNGT